MHKLEITGTTPEDLFMNALRMLTVLLNGGAQPMAPLGDSRREPVVSTVPASDNNELPADAPVADSAPSVATKTKRTKKEQSALDAAEAKRLAALGEQQFAQDRLNDDISDVGGKPAETVAERALTLNEDIKPRLQAIQKACTARGLDMASTVAYILKLYEPFDIKKADQLKPEQFAKFMEVSETYLSGEA